MVQEMIYDMENQLACDVYQPNVTKGTIILIHGGGWFRGDKQKESALAEQLGTIGYLVIAPNYRLAPNYLYPAALNDVLKVYDWLLASDLPVEKGKIAALGSSAGGNLAIELALQKGIAAASWSGIIDLADWVAKHPDVVAEMNQNPNFDQQESRQIDRGGTNDDFYKWFILNYVGQDQVLLQQADPLQRVSAESGPIFLANSLEELVPLSGVYKLQQSLAEQKVPSESKLIAGSQHGEGYADEVFANTLNFLQEYLG